MRTRKWLRWIAMLAGLLLIASIGLSGMLQLASVRRYMLARLEATFGRPVDVQQFEFSILNGARLEARSVTVSENQQFGNEYFLRADSLTAGLRWLALLSGNIEFDSVSLERPSLNLVRDSEGHWNVEHWLPTAISPATSPGFVGPSPGPKPVRLYRFDVDGGRINFKQGNDKSGLALADVSGHVELNGSGRWQLDLEAQPVRIGAGLQDIGTLRLRGGVSGTSARLQPAELNLSWRGASLADALRLSTQFDYGLRGVLAVDVNAQIGAPPKPSESSQWTISAVARLQGLHGWKLPPRNSDPSAILTLETEWRPGESRAAIHKLAVDMPNSHLEGLGNFDWTHGFHPDLHIESSSVGFADVLAVYRALRPGVSDDVSMEGSLGVDAVIAEWPPRINQGSFASTGAKITARSLPEPLRIGPINVSAVRGRVDFAPTALFFSPASSPPGSTPRGLTENGFIRPVSASQNTVTIQGKISPNMMSGAASSASRWPFNWSFAIEGETSTLQNWLALSAMLAQPLSNGWFATGGLSAKLQGVHTQQSPFTLWLGTLDSRGLTAGVAYLNQPLRIENAHADFTKAGRTITLSEAKAFGATWNGTITRKSSDGLWTFDVAADHLDTADLDRWLGPRARPGFLARLTAFGTSAPTRTDAAGIQTGGSGNGRSGIGMPTFDSASHDATVARLSARGRLRVSKFTVASLLLDNFSGDVEFVGRTIAIRKAQAGFFGGSATGSMEAEVLAEPSYRFRMNFDRVDLASLSSAVPSLKSRFSGITNAELNISARGVGRQNLIASIIGNGKLVARNAEIRGFDFLGKRTGVLNGFATRFDSVRGDFRVESGAIDIANFTLDASKQHFQADGRIDFSHAIKIQINPLASSVEKVSAGTPKSPPSGLTIIGTIEAPQFVPPASSTNVVATSQGRIR